MPRIAVTGSRDFTDAEAVSRVLDAKLAQHPDFSLVVGYDPNDEKYQGLDQLAFQWAMDRGVPGWCYPAKWKVFLRAAGPRRNKLMAESGLLECLAFPGGIGTANMVSQCERAGVPVIAALTGEVMSDVGARKVKRRTRWPEGKKPADLIFPEQFSPRP